MKGCEYINESTHNELQRLYEEADVDILKIINLIFEIGTRDLYSSISNYSQATIFYLEEIISVLNNKKVLLPEIDKLQKFSISENNGWGIAFARQEIFDEET